jgi:hypothetical protein
MAMNQQDRWVPIGFRMRNVGLVLVACLSVVLAACGIGDDTVSATPGRSVPATPSASRTAAPVGPADGPPGCLEAQFAWDPASERLLLLNCVGQDSPETVEQVWSWDGQGWTLVADDGPPAMLVTAVAFDTDLGVAVRYGGQPLGGTTCMPETWEWHDGQPWAEVDATPPTACDHSFMVYDAARRVMTMFGGGDAQQNLVPETWNWDGEAWSQVAGPDGGPAARAHFGFVYDPSHEQSLLFGGYDGNQVFGDFWSWDGAAWIELDFNGPSARSHFSMAVSPDGLLLFGGSTGPMTVETLNDETWFLTNGRWRQLEIPGPSARDMAALGYDPSRDVFVLFGGFDADGILAETWEFDGESWQCVLGCEPGG